MYDKQRNRGVHLVLQISCQISMSTSSSPSSDKENAESEMPGSLIKKVQRSYCFILHLGISLWVFSPSGKAYKCAVTSNLNHYLWIHAIINFIVFYCLYCRLFCSRMNVGAYIMALMTHTHYVAKGKLKSCLVLCFLYFSAIIEITQTSS